MFMDIDIHDKIMIVIWMKVRKIFLRILCINIIISTIQLTKLCLSYISSYISYGNGNSDD